MEQRNFQIVKIKQENKKKKNNFFSKLLTLTYKVAEKWEIILTIKAMFQIKLNRTKIKQ